MDDDYFKTRRAIYENVADGRMEVVGEREGEPHFRLTEDGLERARTIIDRYLDRNYDGIDPASLLARDLEVPLEVAAGLIEHRKKERAMPDTRRT